MDNMNTATAAFDSQISLRELAEIERTFGVRLTIPASTRARLDAYYNQPTQLQLSYKGAA